MINEERISRYLERHARKLALIEAMWRDPLVQLYNDPELPDPGTLQTYGSVFLAGPTSRRQILEYNWRSEAVHFLRAAGFLGAIYVPEPRGEEDDGDFTEKAYIHQWESTRLRDAYKLAFWVPRQGTEMLGLNTNFEWGFATAEFLFRRENKRRWLFIGWPDEAERMGLPNHYAVELAHGHRYLTLELLCSAIAGKPAP